MFKRFTGKFSEYTMSDSRFIGDIITEADSYNLEQYLLNDILKLLDKIILNRLSSDLLFQKNYWSWGFITTYYSNFYMAQLLNRIVGSFYMYKNESFNKYITYDKNLSLYNVPQNKNNEPSHLREFKRLKDNFSYTKTWNDIELKKLLDIINLESKDLLFKYTIDNEIQESKIRNEINYRLKNYKEIEYSSKKNLQYSKIYKKIINGEFCNLKDERNFNIVQINQKRFLLLSILIKEIIAVNSAFKIKLNRLNESLEQKYETEFHNVNQNIKTSIQGLLNEI